jgi:TetR/AcrR family transcriptional repressor of lmrAB and yxaGH operons
MTNATDSRTRLLEATADLLADRGFHAMGMKEILKASDTVAGSLYHHFPGGKDELAACSAHLAAERIDARIEAGFRTRTPAATIEAFYAGAIEQLRDSGFATGCPIGTTAAEAVSLSGPVIEALADAFRTWTATMARGLMAHGWASDEATEAASALMSLYQGALLVARAEHDTTPMEVAGRESQRIVRAGPSSVATS